MAEQTTIDSVKAYLPTWVGTLTDWDDTKIGVTLDANNQNVPKTVWYFWLQRVGDLSALTDVIDAGASRPLSQTYQHAQDMLKFWDQYSGFNSTSVGKIKRRYPVRHGRYGYPPYGISPYGGVYVRTD